MTTPGNIIDRYRAAGHSVLVPLWKLHLMGGDA